MRISLGELSINHHGRERKDTDGFPYCTTYRINARLENFLCENRKFLVAGTTPNSLFFLYCDIIEWNVFVSLTKTLFCLLLQCPFINMKRSIIAG